MPSPQNQVVVITGASSGNGRATALEFAKHGARLVLASRNFAILEDVARECMGLGAGAAVALKTDVTSIDQMQVLARTAYETYGQIDVWINNAGVGAVGLLNDTPLAVHRQVIETNLMGVINGSYAVMPYFKKQERGILINTNSVGAWVPLPYATSYSASKFGMRGFLEALRAELSDYPDIHVCEVFPAFVRTPGVLHTANFTRKHYGNPPLSGSPSRVARAMVRVARRPADRTQVMLLTPLARVAYFLLPKLIRWATYKVIHSYLSHAQEEVVTAGAIFQTAKSHYEVEPPPAGAHS